MCPTGNGFSTNCILQTRWAAKYTPCWILTRGPENKYTKGKMAKTEPKQNRDDGNSEELFIDLI